MRAATDRVPVVRFLRRTARGRRVATTQLVLLGLLTLSGALYLPGTLDAPVWVSLSAVCLWILVGGFLLRPRGLALYYGALSMILVLAVLARASDPPHPGAVVTVVAVGVLVMIVAQARERVEVRGSPGEAMLVDPRERLLAQARIPPLARGWQVDTMLRSAYGDRFSGDFLVASLSPDEQWLEIALVDVSGKGQSAGARSLLLSGAFGGLLGSVRRAQFLPTANRYLLRQSWSEGFATAVHVAVDQVNGAFEIRSAGHPPAFQYHRGSGRWCALDGGQGPVLGVVGEPSFPAQCGVLEPGDVLLAYTDGLVERRGSDIALGIDRLVGAAERAVGVGLPGAAARIADGVRAVVDDDWALVLVNRT